MTESNGILGYLLELGPWAWFALGVALIVLETLVPGVHFLWFGLAAMIVCGVSLATGMSWALQLVMFVALSVLMVFVMRRFARPEVSLSDEPDLNVRGAQYVGRTVVVAEPIRDGRGRARVGDTLWQVAGPDMEAGSRARVTGCDGTVLKVEAA